MLTKLLPCFQNLRFESVSHTADAITIVAVTKRSTAQCPLCARRSRRVHSQYRRTVADLPLTYGRRCRRVLGYAALSRRLVARPTGAALAPDGMCRLENERAVPASIDRWAHVPTSMTQSRIGTRAFLRRRRIALLFVCPSLAPLALTPSRRPCYREVRGQHRRWLGRLGRAPKEGSCCRLLARGLDGPARCP
jgi:hypothetical protein